MFIYSQHSGACMKDSFPMRLILLHIHKIFKTHMNVHLRYIYTVVRVIPWDAIAPRGFISHDDRQSQ